MSKAADEARAVKTAASALSPPFLTFVGPVLKGVYLRNSFSCLNVVPTMVPRFEFQFSIGYQLCDLGKVTNLSHSQL